MATILSNGNKTAGQEPDTIETLLDVLKNETLDPSFEDYGRFFYRLPNGKYNAWGNFLTRSHVFNIVGSLKELRKLANAIKENRRSVPYLKALHSRD